MLLFDIIRDWFVMYIWGGYTSTGEGFGGCIGQLGYFTPGDTDIDETLLSGTSGFHVVVNNFFNSEHGNLGQPIVIPLGDWLSTTSTIIVMILLCIVFGLMVRWLFRLTAGLLRGN